MTASAQSHHSACRSGSTLTGDQDNTSCRGCMIDVGSNLTHGTGSPAVFFPHKQEPFLPSQPAISISLLPERRGWALARDRAGRPVEPPTRPLAGPIDRGARAIAVTSDLPGGSNFVFSRPQVVQPGRDCLANNSRNGPSPPIIARCGDTAHRVCGCARAAASCAR